MSEDSARAMVALCERFGHYGMYGEQPIASGLGAGMVQRHDAARNFIVSGGRFARDEPIERLAARTNYFRETYAYAEPLVDGIEEFHSLAGFVESARGIFDRPIVDHRRVAFLRDVGFDRAERAGALVHPAQYGL